MRRPVPYSVSPRAQRAIDHLAYLSQEGEDVPTDERARVGVLCDAPSLRGFVTFCLRGDFEVTVAPTVGTLVALGREQSLRLLVADLHTLEHEEAHLTRLADTFPDVPLMVLSQLPGQSPFLAQNEQISPAAILLLPAPTAEIRRTAHALVGVERGESGTGAPN